MKLKKIIKIISLTLLLTFGLVLLGWTAAFLAVRYGWTNVTGQIDQDSLWYNQVLPLENSNKMEDKEDNEQNQDDAVGAVVDLPVSLPTAATSSLGVLIDNLTTSTVCQLKIINQAGYVAPIKTWRTAIAQPELGWRFVTAAALSQWLTYRSGQEKVVDQFLAQCLEKVEKKQAILDSLDWSAEKGLFTWQNGEEWTVIEKALVKDKVVIEKAAQQAGIKPRILVSAAIVEQLRLYYTQRELFEKFFKPLNILASANKMAWGVMAIKEKTAIATEEHLRDRQSAFYLGSDKEMLLTLPSGNETKTRYQRLTNEKDHYYSYLYGGLYLAQVIEQWSKAGYDISRRPEILVTLFNIGFNNSKPKDNPQVGGSKININGRDYSFGGLGYEFYYSDALIKEFPY